MVTVILRFLKLPFTGVVDRTVSWSVLKISLLSDDEGFLAPRRLLPFFSSAPEVLVHFLLVVAM